MWHVAHNSREDPHASCTPSPPPSRPSRSPVAPCTSPRRPRAASAARPATPPPRRPSTSRSPTGTSAHRDPGGTYDGTRRSTGRGPHALTLGTPTGSRSYTDPYAATPAPTPYDEGSWTSPRVRTAFGLTELVASWNARTPGGLVDRDLGAGRGRRRQHLEVVRPGSLGRRRHAFHPTSLGGQRDDLATVSIDTLVARNGHTFGSYRIRVALLRPAGSTVTPVGRTWSARWPPTVPRRRHASGRPADHDDAATRVLDVPTYSQENHVGDYPQWDNGGEAWCSPTSTSMVVAYWRRGPSPADYAWVTADHPGHTDPWVDYAARHTFDYAYDGAGNWPFNTAYAGRFGLEGFVTRLRDLDEAEQFIKAGIPVVTSVSFAKGELDGAGLRHQRAPDDDRRLHPVRRRGRQRPGLAPGPQRRRGPHDLHRGSSSATPGSATPAASPT